MLSKIKKVLVSLALAASLALAPMNVSADQYITEETAPSGEEGKVFTKVYVKGTQYQTRWTVEVPASITINLDNAKSDPGVLHIFVRAAEDIPTGSTLKVTPTFSVRGEDKVTIWATATQNNVPITMETPVGSTGLKIDANLLAFGTYTGEGAFDASGSLISSNFTADTNMAMFNPPSRDALKDIPINVNKNMTDTAKQNIPTPDNSSGDPRIAENQQIGKITYECELVPPSGT